MLIEHRTEIHVPPEDLWPFLSEVEHQKVWMKGLVDMQTTQGDGGAGSRFKMIVKEGGRNAEYDGEVLAYHRPKHLSVRFWGGSLKPGWAMVADYKLAHRGYSTELDYSCRLEIDQVGFFTKLWLPLFKLFGRMWSKAFMKSLKTLAEKQHSRL